MSSYTYYTNNGFGNPTIENTVTYYRDYAAENREIDAENQFLEHMDNFMNNCKYRVTYLKNCKTFGKIPRFVDYNRMNWGTPEWVNEKSLQKLGITDSHETKCEYHRLQQKLELDENFRYDFLRKCGKGSKYEDVKMSKTLEDREFTEEDNEELRQIRLEELEDMTKPFRIDFENHYRFIDELGGPYKERYESMSYNVQNRHNLALEEGKYTNEANVFAEHMKKFLNCRYRVIYLEHWKKTGNFEKYNYMDWAKLGNVTQKEIDDHVFQKKLEMDENYRYDFLRKCGRGSKHDDTKMSKTLKGREFTEEDNEELRQINLKELTDITEAFEIDSENHKRLIVLGGPYKERYEKKNRRFQNKVGKKKSKKKKNMDKEMEDMVDEFSSMGIRGRLKLIREYLTCSKMQWVDIKGEMDKETGLYEELIQKVMSDDEYRKKMDVLMNKKRKGTKWLCKVVRFVYNFVSKFLKYTGIKWLLIIVLMLLRPVLVLALKAVWGYLYPCIPGSFFEDTNHTIKNMDLWWW